MSKILTICSPNPITVTPCETVAQVDPAFIDRVNGRLMARAAKQLQADQAGAVIANATALATFQAGVGGYGTPATLVAAMTALFNSQNANNALPINNYANNVRNAATVEKYMSEMVDGGGRRGWDD